VCLEAFSFSDIYMSSCCSRVHIHLLVIYCRSSHKRIIPRQQTIRSSSVLGSCSPLFHVYIWSPP
jgi:hypothetical protein